MILSDLHIHSTFSDGKLTIPEIVDLYGGLGFKAIAITDHVCEEHTALGKAARLLGRSLTQATFPLYREIIRSEAERAWNQYKMLVIPGLELSKNSLKRKNAAHLLALGIEDYMTPDEDILTLSKKIREGGGVVIAAHPLSTGRIEYQTSQLWSQRLEIQNYIDAWEISSGPLILKEVHDAKVPIIAGSDFHRPAQIKSWKTVFDCELHPQSIFQSIRQQNLSLSYFHP